MAKKAKEEVKEVAKEVTPEVTEKDVLEARQIELQSILQVLKTNGFTKIGHVEVALSKVNERLEGMRPTRARGGF